MSRNKEDTFIKSLLWPNTGPVDPIHLTSSSNNLGTYTSGQCHCALFSEVRIVGDATFTGKPIDHQKW